MPSERDKKMRRHYRAGHTLRECGELFRLTKQRVKQIFDANGWPTRTVDAAVWARSAAMRSTLYAKMHSCYQPGMSCAQLAEKVGVSPGWARTTAAVLGLRLRTREARPLPAWALAAARKGRTSVWIAARLKISQRAAHKALARAGAIQPKPRTRRWAKLPAVYTARVLRLRRRRLTQRAIGRRLKLCQRTVCEIINREAA